MRRRVIFTGPPGSGKTTLLSVLWGMGIEVVPEAATDLITQMQERGQPEPWTDHLFTERIVALQRQRQLAADAAATGVTAYDRSPVCTLALARHLGHPVSPLLREELDRMKRESTYDRTVLFVESIGQNVATPARRISYEEALIFGGPASRGIHGAGLHARRRSAGSLGSARHARDEHDVRQRTIGVRA